MIIIKLGSLRVSTYVLLPLHLDQSTSSAQKPLTPCVKLSVATDSYSSISDASALISLALELLAPPILWKKSPDKILVLQLRIVFGKLA
jgi:hypothetical protein